MFKGISLFFKEFGNYMKIFDESNKKLRTLVFYSERDIYYQYYEGYINYILENSDLDICYLTSDLKDPVFNAANPRIKPFYIKEFLAQVMLNLDGKVVVMTMPDLGNFQIKRSMHPVNHVYLFHGVGSIHLTYPKQAFDHYDTVLCIGQNHSDEFRKAEQLYSLKPKELIPCGYYRIEKIYTDHRKYLENKAADSARRKKILIGPSWNKDCITESCIYDIINGLKNTEFDVVIRPHPEFIKRKGEIVNAIAKAVKKIPNISMELDMVKRTSIDEADIMITDWSGIAFEYAFGTERPVLFINTPMRIDNPDYQELGIEPMELTLRGQIGKQVNMNELGNILSICRDFIQNQDAYRNQIIKYRGEYLFNWLSSSKAGGKAIIELCNR